MDTIKKKINLERLKKARIDAKLSKAEVARRLNITRQRIHAYEEGIDKMYAEIFLSICAVYGQPAETFTE